MSDQIVLRASTLNTFKMCPMKYRLKHVEGLDPVRETDALRMGSSWHAMHEVYGDARINGWDDDSARLAVYEHLNERYVDIPDWADPGDWEIERQTLAVSFAVYLWYYEDDPVETLAVEQGFTLPLYEPRTGMPLPKSSVIRHGTIDAVIRYAGGVGRHEFKSTSRAIDDGSDYWEKVDTDTQISMYDLAFADLPESTLREWGVGEDEPIGHTLYDVWRKPSIKPAMLSQKDSLLLVDTGEYYGDGYEVARVAEEDGTISEVYVDGESVEMKPGKKAGTFSVRETPDMFASRLMADMMERPEYYFKRRPVVRTGVERQKFRQELYRLYKAIRMFRDEECWYPNWTQCRATFPCEMIPICHGHTDVEDVCDGESEPEGFQRSLTAVTVGGETINK